MHVNGSNGAAALTLMEWSSGRADVWLRRKQTGGHTGLGARAATAASPAVRTNPLIMNIHAIYDAN